MSLKIDLTKPQSQFFVSPHKFTAFVGGFGSGKSHTLFTKILADKLEYPKIDLGYFAPSYQLIRDIAHVRLQNMLDEAEIPYKLNKADNVLDLFDNGRILFRSMDIPDRIVGFEIGNAYIDEIDIMKYSDAENAWNKIIARCRQTYKKDPHYNNFINRLFVATTPEGFNFVYHRWVKEKKPGYHMIQAPTSLMCSTLTPLYTYSIKNLDKLSQLKSLPNLLIHLPSLTQLKRSTPTTQSTSTQMHPVPLKRVWTHLNRTSNL